jgi:hypothetical protein
MKKYSAHRETGARFLLQSTLCGAGGFPYIYCQH